MPRDLLRCRGRINAEIAADAWWHELTSRLARSEPRCLVIWKNCMTWDLGGAVEQWLSRGCACAVRRERQRSASALACRIAGCSPAESQAVGAHFSTAGAGSAISEFPCRFPSDVTVWLFCWGRQGLGEVDEAEVAGSGLGVVAPCGFT